MQHGCQFQQPSRLPRLRLLAAGCHRAVAQLATVCGRMADSIRPCAMTTMRHHDDDDDDERCGTNCATTTMRHDHEPRRRRRRRRRRVVAKPLVNAWHAPAGLAPARFAVPLEGTCVCQAAFPQAIQRNSLNGQQVAHVPSSGTQVSPMLLPTRNCAEASPFFKRRRRNGACTAARCNTS